MAAGNTLLVKHLGDWRSAVLPWKAKGAKVSVAEKAFKADGTDYPAGTYIVENVSTSARDAIVQLGLTGVSAGSPITVAKHALTVPRIALMHSWLETQNEGWVRFAFDHMGIPYTYISDQQLRRANALDRFDVVVFPHVSGSVSSLVNGRPMTGPAIPWKKTAAYPTNAVMNAAFPTTHEIQ